MESAVRTGNIGSIVGETKQSERDCVERVLQIGAARRAALSTSTFSQRQDRNARASVSSLFSLCCLMSSIMRGRMFRWLRDEAHVRTYPRAFHPYASLKHPSVWWIRVKGLQLYQTLRFSNSNSAFSTENNICLRNIHSISLPYVMDKHATLQILLFFW